MGKSVDQLIDELSEVVESTGLTVLMLFVENGSDVAQYTLQLVVQLVLQNVEFLLIKMNRYIFIFTIIAILVLGLYMDSNDMRYYAGFTVFLLSVIAVSIRRIYLKLKPW